MKLFADMERKRRDLAERDQEERKRKREQEIEEEEKSKAQKEWQKNFEVIYYYFKAINIIIFFFCRNLDKTVWKVGSLFRPILNQKQQNLARKLRCLSPQKTNLNLDNLFFDVPT